MQPQRLGDGVPPEEQDRCSPRCSSGRSRRATRRCGAGPEQLAVLREAGVVDAGAYGLTVIVAGMIAALRGDEATPEVEHHTAPARDLHLPQHADSHYRFCTNFVVTGDGLDSPARWCRCSRRSATRCSSSATRRRCKVHVHTDDPDRGRRALRRTARCRASTWRTCASRWPSAPRGSRRRDDGGRDDDLRRRGGRHRRGARAALRGARRVRGRRRRRRSTPRPTTSSRASTRCRPPRRSCCRTART